MSILPERIFRIEEKCLNETMIVKNEKKEEFAISAGSIADTMSVFHGPSHFNKLTTKVKRNRRGKGEYFP